MIQSMPVPALFSQLASLGCLAPEQIVHTDDGFCAVTVPLSDILAACSIHDFPDSEDQLLQCRLFFDDWYLYAVEADGAPVYSLFKLREQEHDRKDSLPSDGDTPGVTVCFIAMDVSILIACLQHPVPENRKKLGAEINRVVAYRGQRHHAALKAYFLEPTHTGAYRIAALYVKKLASFAKDGVLPVPEHYRTLVHTKRIRLPRFIDRLNQAAGRTVCDHAQLFFRKPDAPDDFEAAALLATHTGNTSFHCFAAEVEYHAKYLMPLARIRLPFLGKSVYDSALRADLTVDDREFEGPAPFHRPDSALVKKHRLLHPQYPQDI